MIIGNVRTTHSNPTRAAFGLVIVGDATSYIASTLVI